MSIYDDIKRRREQEAEDAEYVIRDRVASLKTAIDQFFSFVGVPDDKYKIGVIGPFTSGVPSHKKLIERSFFVRESGNVECVVLVEIVKGKQDQIWFRSLAEDDPYMVTIADRYAVNLAATDDERARSYEAASEAL